MSFINKLKNVFIVDEEQNAASDKNSALDTVSSEKTHSNPEISTEDTRKFVEILFKALENKNVEGFDYLEFMQSIGDIKKQNLTGDEVKLFQTGFVLAKTMNVSKDALLNSGKHYLGVLEEEKSHFHNSLTNNAKAKLDEKNKQIIDLQKSLEDGKAKLEALRNTIMKNEQLKINLTEELAQAEMKVNSVKSAFNNAYLSITEKIKSDLDKIEKYL